MMYRQIVEELARLQRDTGVAGFSVRLGEITLEEEKELIQELGNKPEISAVLSWETLKSIDYNREVHVTYSVPTTKESEIAELESKLAKLKGEMINA